MGAWEKGSGTLWWGFGVKDQFYKSDLYSWDKFKELYFEAFDRLSNNEVLRGSFLKKDGKLIHQWPEKPA